MHTIEGILMPANTITGDPVSALRLSTQFLPEGTILFFHNAHFYMEQSVADSHKAVIQAVWNARDLWRVNKRTLVLLSPSITMPAELRNDIAIIDEPLPTDKDLASIVVRGITRASGKRIGKKLTEKLVDAVSGLAAFNAEQVVSMSVNTRTLRPDMDQVWSQKIKLIEQARGLKVYRMGAQLDQIGGNDNIKSLMIKIAHGKRPPRSIVFLDEIEKTTRRPAWTPVAPRPTR